jgi:DNA processing protein
MNSITLRQAVNYATILYFSKYSKKTLHSLPSLFDLIELEHADHLFSQVERLFHTSRKVISQIYNKNNKLFREFESDYDILYERNSLYPKLLRQTVDHPPFLFCQGDLDLLNKKGISVVGTRKPSELGLRRAKKLAMLLSTNGYVIVSGLARGIDTAAHQGAIKAGGKTIGVIGTPLDRFYPKDNTELQGLIARAHLLISQFPFGHPVSKFNFPSRNYTMSGITYATVVIEASETSGALIQARQCMAQGRHLFLLKNLLERKDLRWPKKYAEQGAFIISEIDDVPKALEKLPDYKIDSTDLNQSTFLPIR